MTCIEHFAPAVLRRHIFSLSGVYLLLTVQCKSAWLCKGWCTSKPLMQLLLLAFKSNFLPFTRKSLSFLKPALGDDQLSDTNHAKLVVPVSWGSNVLCPGERLWNAFSQWSWHLIRVGCEMAKTGPLLLPVSNLFRLDFVACDSSCTP